MTGPVSSSIPRAPPPPCQSSGWRMEAIPVGTTWGQKRGHEPIPRVEFGSENTGCRNIKGAWSRQGGSLSQQEPTGAEGSTAQPTRSGQFRWKQCRSMGFPGGSVVKNLPAMQELQETWVRSLGLEDPLEEGMTTHFKGQPNQYSSLGNPMDRGAWHVGYSSRGCKEWGTAECTHTCSSHSLSNFQPGGPHCQKQSLLLI